jgi:CheY-like chemotaxis protein
LVEDDADSRELLASILAGRGASVRTAGSGRAALDLLGAELPDVLVSDIGMPVMDGYALIREVRRLGVAAAARVPALALTAYARAEDERRAFAEGFQMHLTKPVDPLALAVAVSSLARHATSAGP